MAAIRGTFDPFLGGNDLDNGANDSAQGFGIGVDQAHQLGTGNRLPGFGMDSAHGTGAYH